MNSRKLRPEEQGKPRSAVHSLFFASKVILATGLGFLQLALFFIPIGVFAALRYNWEKSITICAVSDCSKPVNGKLIRHTPTATYGRLPPAECGFCAKHYSIMEKYPNPPPYPFWYYRPAGTLGNTLYTGVAIALFGMAAFLASCGLWSVYQEKPLAFRSMLVVVFASLLLDTWFSLAVMK